MSILNDLERAVLNKLLSGNHEKLDNLQLNKLQFQAEKATIIRREYTGVGFYSFLNIPNECPTLSGDFTISRVCGEIEGVEHGATFVLWIKNGRLDLLEGVTFGEPWPEKIGKFSLKYF